MHIHSPLQRRRVKQVRRREKQGRSRFRKPLSQRSGWDKGLTLRSWKELWSQGGHW